jgi:RNA polymerase sigma factor (sigma-70 family)
MLGQVHRLFNIGAMGTMSDGQLLTRFVSRRDQGAEAAFEELVIRHGPMVLRICRGLLHDAHDAEDAFQAVFLVLANRARSIRQHGSVASWLFGVAERVAIRGRRTAARRRVREARVAAMNPEIQLPLASDLDWETLHAEIQGLPERLRTPIVLCYLQGLTYDAAACRLGLTEVAVRGRLARAREQLRIRLTRRGMTVPGGLLAAGAAIQAQAAVPMTLVQGTVGIALGFVAGNEATALARNVLNSMWLNHVRVAVMCVCIGIGSSDLVWQTFAGRADAKDSENSGPVIARQHKPDTERKVESTQTSVTYRLMGSVRVAETGEPVQGGWFTVTLGEGAGASNPEHSRVVTSGADGQFGVELPAGQAVARTFQAPVGYWAPGNRDSPDTFVLSRLRPVYRKDYVVRRGSIWHFRLNRENGRPLPGRTANRPAGGHIRVVTADAIFEHVADEAGRVSLTLPTGQGNVMVTAAIDSGLLSFASLPLAIPLEWAPDFNPEIVKTVEPVSGGYSLTDDAGRLATIGEPAQEFPSGTGPLVTIAEPGRVEPTLVDGKLVIRVVFNELGRVWPGKLAGQIVDHAGQPVTGARVAPAFHFREANSGGGFFPDDAHYEATTDNRGQFMLQQLPRSREIGQSTKISLIVWKEGFANLQTPVFTFRPGAGDYPHVLEAIRMEPGVSLSGTVIDRYGQPAEGVWVRPAGGLATRSQFTRTDAAGKFRVRNLPKGMVEIGFAYGSLSASGKYFADGKERDLKIQLRAPASSFGDPAPIIVPGTILGNRLDLSVGGPR